MENLRYSVEEKERLYQNFLNSWKVLPEAIKHRFLKEQKCVLCNQCITVMSTVQAQVKIDKEAKYGIRMDINDGIIKSVQALDK